MGRILKYLAIGVAAFIVLLVVAVLIIAMTFDPNEYKDEIIAEVESATGRTLEIDGDIGLTLFPVLSLEFGAIRLGNADGFDAGTPFLSLDSASASVRVLPALLSREIRMGTVSVQSLAVNLAVDASGTGNWEDLAAAGEAPADEPSAARGGSGIRGFEVGGLDIADASLVYRDAASGAVYRLDNLRLKSGSASLGKPLDLDAGFDFSVEPQGLSGTLSTALVLTFADDLLTVRDLELEGRVDGAVPNPAEFSLATASIDVDLGAEKTEQSPITLRVGSLTAVADIPPFNYGTGFTPQTKLRVEPFSPKSLMQELGLEPIETADPEALEKVSFQAFGFFNETEAQYQLNDLEIVIDDTTLSGLAGIPLNEGGSYRIGLAGDRIDLTRYMAPPTGEEAAADEEAATVELPVELIRAFNVNANFRLQSLRFGALDFDNLELKAVSKDGDARLHPISADFFGGGYRGDIRIDARTDDVMLSVNERVENINVGALVEALYGVRNVTGQFDGAFQLAGRGADIDAIRRDLDGTLAITLADGAYLGTDLWYQLRRARALLKQEAPPAAPTEPKTEFSSVTATGVVTDGIMRNDDFVAELPFMQLAGKGSVNLVEASVDYDMTARILERPELAGAASEQELAELTEASIPLKITGPLASPSIRPDIGGMLKDRLRDEAEQALRDRLLGDEETAEGEAPPESLEDALKQKAEEELGDKLKDLFKKKKQ